MREPSSTLFLDQSIALWLKGNRSGRGFVAVPEMGPVRGGYNLAQLPGSWEDAKILRTIIAKAWKKAHQRPTPLFRASRLASLMRRWKVGESGAFPKMISRFAFLPAVVLSGAISFFTRFIPSG